MAKRRRVKSAGQRDQNGPLRKRPPSGSGFESERAPSDAPAWSGRASDEDRSRTGLDPLSLASGMLGGAVVYIAYFPSDSVAVEKGDALWLAMLALVIATICLAWGQLRRQWSGSTVAEKGLWVAPWMLASWMMLAVWGTASFGNMRVATNEAWVWFTAAALLTSARILAANLAFRRAITTLVIVCAFGLAVHGMHQYLISLPANRAQYQADPERVLALAGVEAPAGSAERMVFENRLFDGGPTGTFALANSLAACLIVGVVSGVGVMRWRFKSMTGVQRAGWIVVVTLCAATLMATRSRSATLAMFVGILLVLVVGATGQRNRRRLWMGFAVTAMVAVGVVAFLATLGNREWFEQAPASLAFRFQYWRSSWNLVLDHPWFGAGPGNFQALYERYREASAHEQIAEPHNLFVETLASGGWVALGLLGLVLVAGAIRVARRPVDESDGLEADDVDDDRARWVWLGAGLSLGMIWLLGLASRRPPDLGASLFVVPLSVLVAILLWRVMASLPGRAIEQIWLVIVAAVGLHLMAAGGWTVPGVAIAMWLGGGLLTRADDRFGVTTTHGVTKEQTPADARVDRGLMIAALGLGLLLIGWLYGISLQPVEHQRRLMEAAQRTEQPRRRFEILSEAVEADPWSADAVLWLADAYRWSLVLEGDTESRRRSWSSWLEVAQQRAGEDPAVYRMIGAQQLHLFQRHGNPADLQAAAETFSRAVAWSPANQWMMAQMALIARSRGEIERAAVLTARAEELSKLGGNIERALSRQQIYLARPVGAAAAQGPIRVSAAEVLDVPDA